MKVTYREYCMALRALQDKFDRRITITDLGGTLDAPVISLGVNWASTGSPGGCLSEAQRVHDQPLLKGRSR